MVVNLTIDNPQLLYAELTTLTADAAASATSLSVTASTDISIADLLLLEKPGTDVAEVVRIATVPTNTSLTITTGLKFAHNAEISLTKVDFDKIRIYRSATETGVYSLIATVFVDYHSPDQVTTYYDSAGISTDFYKVDFLNSISSVASELSGALSAQVILKGYTNLQLIERFLGDRFDSTTFPSDAAIQGWIEEAEREIDDECQTSFTPVTITQEIYDWNQYTSYKSPEQLALFPSHQRHDYGLTSFTNDKIQLRNSPVISVQSVEINNADVRVADSWQLLTEQIGTGGDFIIKKDTGHLEFITQYPKFGKRAIRISYTYGHSSIPRHVQRLATLLVAKNALLSKQTSNSVQIGEDINIEGFSVSSGVLNISRSMLDMNKEIDMLWNKVGIYRTEAI